MNVVNKGKVITRSSATLLARVQDGQGNNLTNAATTSIVVNIYDADTATLQATLNNDCTTIYDTLQTDGRWSQDGIGYNLAITVPGSSWPTAATYQVECIVCPLVGDSFFILWELKATPVFSGS